ncbi:S-layer homology domain-containing protein [Paenibacillus sp. P25]|nr:S-layer homology domain-containing protein [Paenibacillus sp. P25]
MSYINYGITSSLIQNVDAAKGSLQVISPGYFELNADGSLHLSESLDTGFISAMKLRNIKVVPFLGNEWNQELGRMAMQNRELLSDQIAQAVRTYSLDGVNVDIENLTQADRDNLTDFVKMLRAKLPAGAEVSIAIGADPDGAYTTTTMYDNQAMSPYVDYFMLMAYDEHYPGDPEPGPVASLPYVEKSIQQALKQVPASQLVLGLPFYGRFWNGDPAYNGLGVSDQLAEKLIDTYHGVRTYDETSQSVKGTFTIGTADASVLLNGTPLPAGNYTVWYENERSIKAKSLLVQKYGLKGTGDWSLEQTAADTWDYYSLWLNGIPFTDVAGHWAQYDILRAALEGWMTGTGENRFDPDLPLTRAQAAAVLVRAYGLENTEVTGPSPFDDVPAGHWAWKDIMIAAQKGYMQGTADATFAPDQPLTREQFCQLMARILSLPQADSSAAPAFPDLSTDRWSYAAIAAMRAKSLVDGFEDGTFRPEAPFTRAQMAAILNRVNPRPIEP